MEQLIPFLSRVLNNDFLGKVLYIRGNQHDVTILFNHVLEYCKINYIPCFSTESTVGENELHHSVILKRSNEHNYAGPHYDSPLIIQQNQILLLVEQNVIVSERNNDTIPNVINLNNL